nr:hypothetical protein [Tanacetum cinerariifolium]
MSQQTNLNSHRRSARGDTLSLEVPPGFFCQCETLKSRRLSAPGVAARGLSADTLFVHDAATAQDEKAG